MPLLFLFEKRQVLAVAFFFQLFDWNETQRRRIDAITHAAFVARSVVEDMAKVRLAPAAAYLGAFHSESTIRFFSHVIFVDRFGETGPAAAAVEFVQRSKERLAADNIDINAGAMIVPIFVSKRRLGAALLGHVILLWSQFLFQFVGRRFRRSLIGG